MRQFRAEVEKTSGLLFPDFEALYRWSIESPIEFWQAVWNFDRIQSSTDIKTVRDSARMPGARWFVGANVNYARQILRHADLADKAGHPAIISEDELGLVEVVDWPTLRSRVASFAISLRKLGVKPGDRIAAYLPNRPEAIIGLLSCASIGAIWAVCAPDMGVQAILARFKQIDPQVLIATDGVFYGGKAIDRAEIVQQLRQSLPNASTLVLVPSGYSDTKITGAIDFVSMTSLRDPSVESFEPDWLPFDHPLWIVYSSGTTGKPKALVHGHGGILLGAASARLHSDIGASYDLRTPGERFHWYSSTGWMMWNSQVSGLLCGATICIFDGSPMGSRTCPDSALLWRFAARNRITFFGSGAQFYTMCERAPVDFSSVGDLSRLRALGSTASPLPAPVQSGISKRLADAGKRNVWWFNSSGGTDICGAFCTGNLELPESPGKLQCRQLGAAVEAWDEKGIAVIDQVGELVCTQPLPNMPLFLWGDDDGSVYSESYFQYYGGIWRQGDWLKIEPDGTCEIYGRSDATINRGGHRMGTSEIYAAVEQLDCIADSLVVDVRINDADSLLVLFVVPSNVNETNDAITSSVGVAIRSSLSPRFVPDRVFCVSMIPRTLSSKKLELPIKRLLEGTPLNKVVDPAAMSNPECLDEYAALIGRL